MEDRYYMTYILFYVLGTMTQVPSQFFITATEYWMFKFRDPATEEHSHLNRTQLQASFTSNFSIISASSHAFFFIATGFFLRKFTAVKVIAGSISSILFLFILNLIFVEIDTDDWQQLFFAITLAIGFFITGIGTAFMLSFLQIVARFPPEYLPGVLSGQAICGIFAAIAQVIALAIGTSAKADGFIYFLIGTFFVVLSLTSFLITSRTNTFFRFYLNRIVEAKKSNFSKELFLLVLNKIKFYMIAMFVVMGSTVMVHPAVTSLVVSKHKGNGDPWHDIYFVPVMTFLTYNIFDYFGRELGARLKRPSSDVVILVLSLVRVLLAPMLMFCNAHPRAHLPVVFDEDYAYYILIVLFAVTHGYLFNLCALQVPLHMKSTDELKVAMVILVVFMMASGLGCSFLSKVIVEAL